MALVLYSTLPNNASATSLVNLGDTTIEQVQSGSSSGESLQYWFNENGITNKDGSPIDPVSHQLQYELFHTDVPREYQVEFLGIGHAGYHSPVGFFTYAANPYDPFDPSYIAYGPPLFTQNEAAANTVYNFSIGSDTFFGFYLNSNGSGTYLSTLIAANPVPNSNQVIRPDQYSSGLDHALFFMTNMGYTIAFEDIAGGGDFDFEDLVINFYPRDGSGFEEANFASQPVPEPGTFFLIGLGLLLAAKLQRKIGTSGEAEC